MSGTTRRQWRYREGCGRKCCAFCRESVRNPAVRSAPRFPCPILEEIADARMLCDRWVAIRHQDAAVVAATEKLEEATALQQGQIVLNTPDVEGILDELRILEQRAVQQELALFDVMRHRAYEVRTKHDDLCRKLWQRCRRIRRRLRDETDT